MPKLEPGPPVLVRLVAPLPRPGLTRMDDVAAGKRRAEAVELMQRAGVVAHAAADEMLASARDGICEVSWIVSGGKPARSARSTS